MHPRVAWRMCHHASMRMGIAKDNEWRSVISRKFIESYLTSVNKLLFSTPVRFSFLIEEFVQPSDTLVQIPPSGRSLGRDSCLCKYFSLSQEHVILLAANASKPCRQVIQYSCRMKTVRAEYVDVIVLSEESPLLRPEVLRTVNRHLLDPPVFLAWQKASEVCGIRETVTSQQRTPGHFVRMITIPDRSYLRCPDLRSDPNDFCDPRHAKTYICIYRENSSFLFLS